MKAYYKSLKFLMLIKLAFALVSLSYAQMGSAADANSAAIAICACISEATDFVETATATMQEAEQTKQYSKIHEIQIGASIMRRNVMQCLTGLLKDYPELDQQSKFTDEVLNLSQQQCGLEDLLSEIN